MGVNSGTLYAGGNDAQGMHQFNVLKKLCVIT